MEKRRNKENKLDSELADQIMSIFKKPYPDRKPEEHQEVLSILRELYFFRSKFSDDANRESFLIKCEAAMQLEFFPPGSAVYHYGDPSTKIYIIIKGKVRRYVKRIMDMTAVSPNKISRNQVLDQSSFPSPQNSEVFKPELRRNGLAPIETQTPQSLKMNSPVLSRNFSIMKEPQQSSVLLDNPRSNKGSPKKLSLMSGTQQLSKMGGSPNPRFRMSLETGTPNQNDLSLNPHKSLKVHHLARNGSSPTNLFSHVFEQLQAESSSSLQHSNSIQLFDASPFSLIANLNPLPQPETEEIFQNRRHYIFEELPLFESFFERRHQYFISGLFRFQHKRTYCPGESFGEMGTTFNSSRIATLVTETNTCLLSIDKFTFQSIFSDEIKFNQDKVQFLQNIFSAIPSRYVSDFASYFKRKMLPQHAFIYKQADVTDSLYFIRDGEVRLSRQMKTSLEDGEELTTGRATSEKEKSVNITTLVAKQLLGEEELIKIPKRIFTATVASNRCVIFKISSKNFQMLQDLYPDIVIQMETEFNARSQWRYDRVNYLGERTLKDVFSKKQQLEAKRIPMAQKFDEIVNQKTVEMNDDQAQRFLPDEYALPRFISKIFKYHELGSGEQEQLDHLANVKMRFAHNQVRLKNKYELYHTPPVTQTKEPLSLWRASLKEQGAFHPKARALLRFRYGDEEGISLPKSMKDNKRNSSSLDRLTKDISRIIQSKQPLQTHDISFVKSIPTFSGSSKILPNLNESVITELGRITLPDQQAESSFNPIRKQSMFGGAHRKHSSMDVSMLGSLVHNQEDLKTIDTTAVPSMGNMSKFVEPEIRGRKQNDPLSQKLSSLVQAKNNSPALNQRGSVPRVFASDSTIISSSLQNPMKVKTEMDNSFQYHFKNSYQNNKRILPPFQ